MQMHASYSGHQADDVQPCPHELKVQAVCAYRNPTWGATQSTANKHAVTSLPEIAHALAEGTAASNHTQQQSAEHKSSKQSLLPMTGSKCMWLSRSHNQQTHNKSF